MAQKSFFKNWSSIPKVGKDAAPADKKSIKRRRKNDSKQLKRDFLEKTKINGKPMSYFTHVLLPVLGMFILCASFIVFMIQGGVGAAKYTSTTTHGVAVSTMVYIQYFVVGAVMLIAGVGLLIFQKIKALGLWAHLHISEEGSDNATDIRNERIEASNKRRDSEIQETYKNIDDDSWK